MDIRVVYFNVGLSKEAQIQKSPIKSGIKTFIWPAFSPAAPRIQKSPIKSGIKTRAAVSSASPVKILKF